MSIYHSSIKLSSNLQVFYLQQNHARFPWPWGTRRQNFCFMGNNRKFSLLSLIKSNFLLFFFFVPFLFIIHLPGERLLMYIDLLGRGLTIWSMIIATMVTLSQLLGNVISTNINQSVTSFLSWSYVVVWEMKLRPVDYLFFFRYPVMTRALMKAGRPIFFSLCEW